MFKFFINKKSRYGLFEKNKNFFVPIVIGVVVMVVLLTGLELFDLMPKALVEFNPSINVMEPHVPKMDFSVSPLPDFEVSSLNIKPLSLTLPKFSESVFDTDYSYSMEVFDFGIPELRVSSSTNPE